MSQLPSSLHSSTRNDKGGRNAGSTLWNMISSLMDASHVDTRISQERVGDAMGAVAGGVFRKGTARLEFSIRGGADERRRRAFGDHTEKECVPDDEPISICGRSFDGGAVSQNG